MKNYVGFLSLTLSGMLFVAAPACAEIPDTDPRIFGLDELWPPGGLEVEHPPFIYDAYPDSVASKATFKTRTCLGLFCSHASAFFIETERDDEKVCAIAAGHSVENRFLELADLSDESLPGDPMKDWDHLPGNTTIALNYRRLRATGQELSFFGNAMPAKSIQVVQYFYEDPLEQGGHLDVALLLIDTSRMKGKSTTSMLPYAYAAAGSVIPGKVVVKGHPKGWPLHRSQTWYATAYANRFSLAASFMDGSVTKGASGGPWLLDEDDGFAFAATAGGKRAEDPRNESVIGTFLTPLKKEIEETCKQSATPKYVYKTSTTVPTVAFAEGFVPPGGNRDVVAHVSGASCHGAKADTAFISTTKNQAVAYERALAVAAAYPGKEVYVYRIRADAKFYNARKSLQDSMRHFGNTAVSQLTLHEADLKYEYLFVDDVTSKGILSENIASAFMFRKDKDGAIRHEHFSNTNFKPLQTMASSFTYVGPESSEKKLNVTWMSKIGDAAPNGSCLMSGSIPEEVRHFPAEVLLHQTIHQEF